MTTAARIAPNVHRKRAVRVLAVWLLVTFTLTSGGVLGDASARSGDASAPHLLGKRQSDSACLPRPFLTGITPIILKGPTAPDPDDPPGTAAALPSSRCPVGSPGLVAWGVPYGSGLTTSRTPTGPPAA